MNNFDWSLDFKLLPQKSNMAVVKSQLSFKYKRNKNQGEGIND
jgi:hypothetical protein